MIPFVCQECGTKRRYSDDRAGSRVSCPICGHKTRLPGDDDDDSDGDEDSSGGGRRRKTKSTGRRSDDQSEMMVLQGVGLFATLISFVILWAAFLRRPIVLQALLASPLGWVIGFVYCALMGMGIKAAVGGGVVLSRETTLKGKSGIQTGIGIVLAVAGLTFGGLEFLGETGKAPQRPAPVVEFLPSQPQPGTAHSDSVSVPVPVPVVVPVASNPADATDERRRFTDARGFSLIPPPGWESQLLPGKNVQVFVGPVSDGFRANISFAVEPFTASLGTYVDQSLAEHRTQYPTHRVVSRSPFAASSALSGQKVIIEGVLNGPTLHLTLYFFSQSGRVLMIIAGVAATDAPRLDAALDASVKTLRFDASSTNSQPIPIAPSTQPQPTSPQQPSASNNVKLFSTTVVEYSGTADLVAAAKSELASVAIVDVQSVQYDASSATLSMKVSGNSISTRTITEALERAGIRTQGVRIQPVR